MARVQRVDPSSGGLAPRESSGVRRGFPHMELIHDSLKRLVPAIKPPPPVGRLDGLRRA